MTWKICESARKNVTDTESDFSILCYNEEEASKLTEYLNNKYGEWELPKEEELTPIEILEEITPKKQYSSEKSKVIPFDDKYKTHQDLIEYDEILHWMSKTNQRLTEIDEIYKEEFKVELANAIETGVDFKKIYGGNTEKTRKQYVDEQLSDLLDEKKMLKAYQSDDNRKLDFLKLLIQFKIKMIHNKEAHL